MAPLSSTAKQEVQQPAKVERRVHNSTCIILDQIRHIVVGEHPSSKANESLYSRGLEWLGSSFLVSVPASQGLLELYIVNFTIKDVTWGL